MLHKVTKIFVSSALYICAHLVLGPGKIPPLPFCISNSTLFYFYISVFGLVFDLQGEGEAYNNHFI